MWKDPAKGMIASQNLCLALLDSRIKSNETTIKNRPDCHPDVYEELDKCIESREELVETMSTQAKVRRFMEIEQHNVENSTRLAENTAWEFNKDAWLDDETHWVWDLAFEYMPEVL